MKQFSNRTPKWAETKDTFVEPVCFGGSHSFNPQLPTKLMPIDDGFSIPSTYLRDIIDRTQYLVFLSAQVAAHGPNPDLQDTRKIDKPIRTIATLKISPFASGSFIIPAELPDQQIAIETDKGTRQLSTSDIINSFATMMQQLSRQGNENAHSLPIGMIQAIESIGVNKYVSKIEYTASCESIVEEASHIVVNTAFVEHASSILARREGKSKGLATVHGQLVSLDLINERAKIRVSKEDGSFSTVACTFNTTFSERLVRLMAEEITVSGAAEKHKGEIRRIKIMQIKDLD